MVLKNAIDYVPGQIVNKQILDSAAGDVVVVAFDAGKSLPTHAVEATVMIYVLEGEVKINSASGENTLRGGDYITLGASEPHSVAAVSNAKLLRVKLNK